MGIISKFPVCPYCKYEYEFDTDRPIGNFDCKCGNCGGNFVCIVSKEFKTLKKKSEEDRLIFDLSSFQLEQKEKIREHSLGIEKNVLESTGKVNEQPIKCPNSVCGSNSFRRLFTHGSCLFRGTDLFIRVECSECGTIYDIHYSAKQSIEN